MLRKAVAALTYGALFASFAVAQEDYTRFRSEATAQALGSFVKQTNSKGVEQDATNSGGVLGSYRFFFDRHNGVEVNYGYMDNTQKYGQGRVDTNAHEFSAAYILQFPRKRWSPFVLAGTGGLVFDPKDTIGASTQTRAAFLYGGGADFNLTDHLFVRGEYRGFIYNSPAYDLTAWSGLDRITHRAEPSVGFGWRF
jgi:opacity protein-like surface antigen